MLVTLNIYADVLAKIIVGFVLVFWVGHFTGCVLTGRVYRKFVKWEWGAHHDVIPATPKVMHGVHVFFMIALGISGGYIRFPFFSGGREFMRYIHYVSMYIVVVNMISRVYYAYQRDSREFIITKRDVFNVPNVIMYYAFIKGAYPHLAKYNPMQKMTYGIMFPIFMVIQAYTGFCLVWPGVLLFPFTRLFGAGLAGAAAYARVTHFTVCMMLVMLTGIHMYLATMEGFPSLLDFFGIKKLGDEEHDEHGEHGEHGEENHEPEEPVRPHVPEPAFAMPGGGAVMASPRRTHAPVTVAQEEEEEEEEFEDEELEDEDEFEDEESEGSEELEEDEEGPAEPPVMGAGAGMAATAAAAAATDAEPRIDTDEDTKARLAAAAAAAGTPIYDEGEELGEEDDEFADEELAAPVQCQAKTRLGRGCKRQALPGSQYCALHQQMM